MGTEKLTAEDLRAIVQYATNNYTPDSVTVTIEAFLGLPQAFKDTEDALKNAKLITAALNQLLKSGFVLGNGALVVVGGQTVIASGINYLEAKNKAAKICYGLSVLCSGTGSVSSSVAIFCEKCGFSNTGVLGDSLGYVFLKAGDKMNKLGQRVEAKRKNFFGWRGGQLPARRPTYSTHREIAFISTGCSSTISFQEFVSNLPYERIFLVGSTVLAIYSYGKLLVSVYNFLDSKFYQKKNYSQQVKYSAKFLINSLSDNRVYRIYSVALQLN